MRHPDEIIALPVAARTLIDAGRLPASIAEDFTRVWGPLARRILEWRREGTPLILGLCGLQGSGKSTLTVVLADALAETGLRVATLSIDDLYLPHAERQRLARELHPLFATRGVPGTHDVALGLSLLDRLALPGPVALPRFDKATDDRTPEESWPLFDAPADVVILEGWCVGARPEPCIGAPLNRLEREEDADSRWRRAVNAALAGPYQRLFGRLDRLILLAAPGFEVVRGWRIEQERALAQDRGSAIAPGLMDDAGIDRFIMHYERLSRWILREMPDRADAVIDLDAARRPTFRR